MVRSRFYRITYPPPPLPGLLPVWQAEIARTVQWVFFGLMVFMPLVGWGYVNPLGQSAHIWWLFTLPTIAGTDPDTLKLLDWAHEYGAQFFMIVIGVPMLGGLFHGIVKRDGVLSSMLPWAGGR